jgi:hypothetical protein
MFFRKTSDSTFPVDIALPSSFKEGSQWIDLFSGHHAQVTDGQFRSLSSPSSPFALRDLLSKQEQEASLDLDNEDLNSNRYEMSMWVLDSHPCLLSFPPLMD